MGKVLSIMVRQSRRILVQERAERIISKPKPTVHPLYPTEEKILKQLKAEHPELEQNVTERQPSLEERVGAMRITSKEIPEIHAEVPKLAIEDGAAKDTRLLPQSRLPPEEGELGFYEPPQDKVLRGRILFSKAMELLQMREKQQDAAVELAKQCGVNENDANLLLTYFAPFTLSANLKEEPKLEIIDESKTAIGQRAFLQKHRLVSDLEQQRLRARLEAKSSDSADRLQGGDKSDQKT